MLFKKNVFLTKGFLKRAKKNENIKVNGIKYTQKTEFFTFSRTFYSRENVRNIYIWLLRFFKKYQFGELSGTEKACFCGCVQYVFLGLDLEYATNWTDLTRALRLLAGKSINLNLYKSTKVINPYDRGTLEACSLHRAPNPSPLPLCIAKTCRNNFNEEITPLLPTEIGERFSQTISNLGHAALLRRCELPL